MKSILLALAMMITPQVALAQDVTATTMVTERSILPAGQFVWNDEFATDPRVYIQVNVRSQMIYVFRGELMIGAASVSTGKDGKATPLGSFTVLQKHKDHRSNKYNNAPMPYMMRLTWDGVALHSGQNPGFPASHGCVRLPDEFARQLFEVVRNGDAVEVIDEAPAFELSMR